MFFLGGTDGVSKKSLFFCELTNKLTEFRPGKLKSSGKKAKESLRESLTGSGGCGDKTEVVNLKVGVKGRFTEIPLQICQLTIVPSFCLFGCLCSLVGFSLAFCRIFLFVILLPSVPLRLF